MKGNPGRRPKVSVIMPVYNAEHFLPEAIESILKQTFTAWEFIIIDDGSTDASWKIIREYARAEPRIVALRNGQNLRISRTLNRGLQTARGQYIARMDADDISALDRLEKQVAYMDQHPEVGVCGGKMQMINAAGAVIGQRPYYLTDSEIRRRIFRYSPFAHPTIIMRKAVLEKCGYYDPAFDYAEDYELYFRVGRIATFGNLPDVTLRYRVLPRSTTSSVTKKMELKTLAARKKAVKEYGYCMTRGDRIYLLLQYISVYTMPYAFKIWLFNQLASQRK